MAIFKEVESGSGIFEKKLVTLPQTTLTLNELNFTKCDRTDLSGRFFGNLFSSFNLPITSNDKNMFNIGKYANTAFKVLNQDKVIIIEIPKNTYGEMIDGKNINLTVPIVSGATPMVLSLFSSFFKGTLVAQSGEKLYSDPNQFSEQFGQAYSTTEEIAGQSGAANPVKGYSSNVAYMFCDTIQKPANNASASWSTQGKFVGRITTPTSPEDGTKYAANFDASSGVIDVPVGIAYLDKGFIVITHPTIVNNINYAIASNKNNTPYTGDANFTEIHFAADKASATFNSFNTEFIQHAICFCLPNEFFKSNNPTFAEAYGEDNLNNNPVAITEIGLYNANHELIAIAKTNQPVFKTKSSLLTFDVKIKV